MSGDEHSSDESMIGRDEFEALQQDSANERAVICASVEDLKAEMGVRFAEVLAAVRDRDGGATAGGAAGAAPVLGYGGASAAAGVAPASMYAGGAAGAAPTPGYGGACAATGVAPAPMYGGANAGYGLHRVESSPGLLQGAGRYGSGGGLGFTPAFPFGEGGLNVDSGGYGMGTGMSHSQRRMEKVLSDQRVNAWSAVNSRMWWVVMGCFPPKLEKPSLQGLMHDSFEVTDAVADMLLNFRGFDPVAFAPRGAGGERIPIATHLSLMAGAFITIARRGIVDDPRLAAAVKARVDRVEASFQAVIDDVERHTRENYAAIQMPHNRDIFLTFIVKDMDRYTRDVQMFADEMQRRFVLPPPSAALPPAPLPAFHNLAAYLRSGGLINSAVQGRAGRSSAAAAGAGGKGGTAREPGPCYQFQKDGTCRWGKACKFVHVAPRKASGKGGKRGGVPGGGAADGGSRGSSSAGADTNAPAATAPAKRAKVGAAGAKTRSSAKGGAADGAKDDDEE